MFGFMGLDGLGYYNIIIMNIMSSVWVYYFNIFGEIFMDKYLLERQIMFSRNIECCREVIFDLRYLDIVAAKKIADLYCTDLTL